MPANPVRIVNKEGLPVDSSNPLAITSVSGSFSTSTAVSGQIPVATAGTAVQGTNVVNSNGFYVRALDDNLAMMYVGNDGAGDVSPTTGYELAPGESIVIHNNNMNSIWFDAIADGDKACWIKA